MTKTFNAHTFNLFAQERDAVVLRDFSTLVDSLAFKRTAPKRQKDFPGMEKSEMKVTLINPATGEIVGIVSAVTSIRADALPAVRDGLKATFRAAVADAAWDDLVNSQRLPSA